MGWPLLFAKDPNMTTRKPNLPIPAATARYNLYTVVRHDNGNDATEFFYLLNELMGYPRGHLPPGTGLEWALAHLSAKHASKLTRGTRNA
jgi:hypothetical protein